MIIDGNYDCCDSLPEYLEFLDDKGQSFLISLEDIVCNEDLSFHCDDAYLLGEISFAVSNSVDSELDFIYKNCKKIVEDMQAGVFYNNITFKENNNIVTAIISDDANTPGKRILKITASWDNNAILDKEKEKTSNAPRPILKDSNLYSIEEVELMAKSISPQNLEIAEILPTTLERTEAQR